MFIKVALFLPGLLCIQGHPEEDMLSAPLILDTEMQQGDGIQESRDSRDAAVPGVIINKGLHDLPSPNLSPVYTPTFSSSPVSELDPHPAVPTPVHPIEPVHLVDPVHSNPIYSPPKPVHVPTKAKCRIEEVEVVGEICTPTVRKDCTTLNLKTKGLEMKEDCFKIVKTVCTENPEEEDNEVCFYQYTTQEEQTEAQTVKVEYDIRCEESTIQPYCPPQPGYGVNYSCKHQTAKTCYQEPSTSDTRVPVTVAYPVPNRTCENKPVSLPRVQCQEVETEECISLPYPTMEKIELERCGSELGKLECTETVLTLPKQICEEYLESYHPSAPSYAAPTPSYAAPTPSYASSVPSYDAPAPSYAAPAAPSYGAPVYAAQTFFSG
ncbi:uncharacterized protein LOC111713299 [Eurytemora carolleeae]|uniref:uncharacterized protein LOC111713299 n=1 Tax=Eurytemora carolleeae TaxID=1294199 RepID=UPI000C77C514|nr:uncharacterized protein LOC111713299 [Eurytemora carolleeae]|eukprot:XP_023343904.1 uncharacterized protein LOC111713299 [Eurytemora affinis]